jgi:hypothetical protein
MIPGASSRTLYSAVTLDFSVYLMAPIRQGGTRRSRDRIPISRFTDGRKVLWSKFCAHLSASQDSASRHFRTFQDRRTNPHPSELEGWGEFA